MWNVIISIMPITIDQDTLKSSGYSQIALKATTKYSIRNAKKDNKKSQKECTTRTKTINLIKIPL